eukprot:gene12384-biopygen4512
MSMRHWAYEMLRRCRHITAELRANGVAAVVRIATKAMMELPQWYCGDGQSMAAISYNWIP